MPPYSYKAKAGPGKTVQGDLDAESRAAALLKLDAMGYSPVWVREGGSTARQATPRRRRVHRREVTLFTRQLASMTRSSVPILRALSTVREQTEHAGMEHVIGQIEADIRDGGMLSSAMARHAGLFPDVYVNLIRAGESAGRLDEVLTRLAETREKEDELRRKVQAATAYPLLIVGVGLATVFVLLTYFLPKVVGLFKNYRDLPWPTRLLIGSSEFFSSQGYWILLVALLAAAILKRLASAERGRLFFDRLQLRVPGLGGLLLRADLARFARTLSLLVDGGIPIDRALKLSGDTLQNSVLRAEMEAVREATVLQGVPLSTGLKRSRSFPPLVGNMTAVGEEAGRLDESLREVASFYEQDVDHQIRLATSLLEPVLILGVGGIVGFIVAAMLLPIFRLSTSL